MTQQTWLYVIIGATTLVLVAAIVVLSRLAWRKQVRRYIVSLVGHREAILAAFRTLEGVIARLASGTVKDVLAFAGPDSEDRRVVAEVAARMRIEAGELASLALPKRLWKLADELGKAATSLAEQAAGVGESEGDGVLDALSSLELTPAREALAGAETEIRVASDKYGLEDAVIYGGGLYI